MTNPFNILMKKIDDIVSYRIEQAREKHDKDILEKFEKLLKSNNNIILKKINENNDRYLNSLDANEKNIEKNILDTKKQILLNQKELYYVDKYRQELLCRELYKNISSNNDEFMVSFYKNLSPATGIRRKIQLCEVILLKHMNTTCNNNNIKYFITSGTLLGAVRGNGFIPWDDDIDTCVFRKDIYHLIDKMDCDDFLIQEYYKLDKWNLQHKFRIKFKKFSLPIFVDVFLIDYSEKDAIEATDIVYEHNRNMFKEATQKLQKKCYYKGDEGYIESKNIVDAYIDKLIKANAISLEKNTNTVWSVENVKSKTSVFGRVEDVFPACEIEFEGIKCKAPKNYLNILNYIYGDIYKIPDDLLKKHFNVTKEILDEMNKCLKYYNIS